MHKNIKNRIIKLIIFLIVIISGLYIILYNIHDNIVFYHPPSDIHKININRKARIGGLVEEKSIENIKNNIIKFNITDNQKNIIILYKGNPPALFRENQGVIAEGYLISKDIIYNLSANISTIKDLDFYARNIFIHNKKIKYIFIAVKLLTKHDENYKPQTK